MAILIQTVLIVPILNEILLKPKISEHKVVDPNFIAKFEIYTHARILIKLVWTEFSFSTDQTKLLLMTNVWVNSKAKNKYYFYDSNGVKSEESLLNGENSTVNGIFQINDKHVAYFLAENSCRNCGVQYMMINSIQALDDTIIFSPDSSMLLESKLYPADQYTLFDYLKQPNSNYIILTMIYIDPYSVSDESLGRWRSFGTENWYFSKIDSITKSTRFGMDKKPDEYGEVYQIFNATDMFLIGVFYRDEGNGFYENFHGLAIITFSDLSLQSALSFTGNHVLYSEIIAELSFKDILVYDFKYLIDWDSDILLNERNLNKSLVEHELVSERPPIHMMSTTPYSLVNIKNWYFLIVLGGGFINVINQINFTEFYKESNGREDQYHYGDRARPFQIGTSDKNIHSIFYYSGTFPVIGLEMFKFENIPPPENKFNFQTINFDSYN